MTDLALSAQRLDAVPCARTSSIVETILGLARQHGVAYKPTPDDAFAADVSRLSDAEVVPDAVEDLLQALTRADAITHGQRLALHAIYLREGKR